MEKGKFVVTPWEVSGQIDYNYLVKEFGTQRIDEKLLNRIKKHTKELHYFLRRGIFFSHRDLDWILNEYEKGNKFFLYTGRAPRVQFIWVTSFPGSSQNGCKISLMSSCGSSFLMKKNSCLRKI